MSETELPITSETKPVTDLQPEETKLDAIETDPKVSIDIKNEPTLEKQNEAATKIQRTYRHKLGKE